MTQEEYIKTHPEQFKDCIDKWLFMEFDIIGGCCSAEKSHEYHIARMVAEKLTDVFIDGACEFLKSYRQDTPDGTGYIAGIVNDKTIDDFKKYMKGK